MQMTTGFQMTQVYIRWKGPQRVTLRDISMRPLVF